MKVCIQFCHGLCSPVTTAARLACYVAYEQAVNPLRSDLGCGPALNAGVREDLEFVENDLILAVEGCEKECSRRLIERLGRKVAASILVPEALRARGVDTDRLSHQELHLDHPAVRAIAKAIAQVADELLSGAQRTLVSGRRTSSAQAPELDEPHGKGLAAGGVPNGGQMESEHGREGDLPARTDQEEA